jgi:hypothetical protein
VYEEWWPRRHEVYITWVKGHARFEPNSTNETVDEVAKEALLLPRAPGITPAEAGDLVYRGAQVTHKLILLIGSLVVPRHHWVGMDIGKTFSKKIKGPISAMRKNWIAGEVGQGLYGFDFSLKYKTPLPCVLCGNQHPLDFLTAASHCDHLHTHAAISHFFTPFKEFAYLVKGWWTQASTYDRRWFLRSLIPTSLVNWVEDHGPPMFSPWVLWKRWRQEWDTMIRDFFQRVAEDPNFLPTPLPRHPKPPMARDVAPASLSFTPSQLRLRSQIQDREPPSMTKKRKRTTTDRPPRPPKPRRAWD